MSYLVAAPELLASAATDLEGIGTALTAANGAAAAPTTAFFARHAQEYQALGARVSAFHQQFVQAMNAGAGSYAAAEAANASPLQSLKQDLLGAINAPPRRCFSVTWRGGAGGAGGAIFTGASGTPGTGGTPGDGGAGGQLLGSNGKAG